MNNSQRTNLFIFALFLWLTFSGFAHESAAQNTAFTFQGKLNESGAAANGQYDLQFKLYDAPTGGTLLGTLTSDNVQVTDGIFTATLNYGADVFYSNSGRYLEVGVRAGSSTGAFTTINPRQELTAAPYSLQAARASKAGDAENFGGQSPSAYLRSNVDQTFTGGTLLISPSSNLEVLGSLFGNGFNLFNLNASNIAFGTLADARLSGNIPRLNAYNIFTGGVQFNVPPLGSGEFLTNLGAGNITTGTLSDARLSANIPLLNAGNTFTAANNNFAGRISANSLSVGGGSPVTKILTGSATLDFGNGRIYQQVLTLPVIGARVGDAVFLSVPPNVMPVRNLPANPSPPAPATVVTTPYIFQAHVSAPDTVSVTWYNQPFPMDFSAEGNTCLFPDTFGTSCYDPPPGVFRVVVFSFEP